MPDQSTSKPPPLHGEVVFDSPPVPKSPQEGPLALVDWLSYLMDRLFVIPGTNQRAGLNAVFMALPVLGDIIPSVVSVFILAIGLSSYRVPRIVAARMLLNSLLDISLGWIPVFGDLFDLFFKADTRNVRLLQEYAGRDDQQPRSTWRHWAFVLGLAGLVVLILVLLTLGAISLVQWLVRAFQTQG